MSYQVLARKYRPASFEELEGQEHVLRALVNALENNRLHHAYLFTGTRGVGKTTIARILARCLNCEQGISAKPCGTCGTCQEIAEGRSVDLIEVDAASRTKVEDTRELLDNVQYMPSHNRFKVYLIDEVHMLSTHSFNALLKTLEEPPEHVKFLLATTDPKKLPVTVLSRCLQFNLKNLSPERVVSYLQQILPVEGIEFEEEALWLLGRAADGSMRDALSLTDQAISFGNNAVNQGDVKLMLGSIDQREVYALLEALLAKDGKAMMEKVAQLAEHAPDYSGLLAEMLAVLHRIALAQAVPGGLDNSQGDKQLVQSLASALSAEDVQLFYQIGVVGQRDLPFAPNLRTGFEMILLRMLAFTPNDQGEDRGDEKKNAKNSELEQSNASTQAAESTSQKKSPSSPAQLGQLLTSLKTDSLSPAEGAETSSEHKTSVDVNRQEKNATPKPELASHTTRPVQTAQSQPELEDDSDIIDFGDSSTPDVASLPSVDVDKALDQSASALLANSSSEAIDNNKNQPVQDNVPAEKTEPKAAASAPLTKTDVSPVVVANDTGSHSTVESAEIVQTPQKAMPTANGNSTAMVSLTCENWVDVLAQLGLSGVTQSVASNCCMTNANEQECTLLLDESHASLWNKNHETRIEAALSRYYERPIQLTFEVGQSTGATPAHIQAQRREAARLEAVKIIESDANVRKLIDSFDGILETNTITARQQKNGT